MLSGRLPRLVDEHAAPADQVRAAVALQVEAGLDIVFDGGGWWADDDADGGLTGAIDVGDRGAEGLLVRSWRATRSMAAGATVGAVLPGPYSMAIRRGAPDSAAAVAARLRLELVALADAGCPLVVVEEPEAVRIGGSADARARFRAAHTALLGDEPPLHAMLAITGGSAHEAGAEAILDAPYRSYLLDLIAGPDNWYLARAVPGDRGIVCAALVAPAADDQAPVLVWAAHYAASMDGRGPERVGLANASSLAGLAPDVVRRAASALVRAASFAAMEPEEAVAAGLDRRTFAQPPGRGARRKGFPRA